MIGRALTIASCIGLLTTAITAAAPQTSRQAQQELRQLKTHIESTRKKLSAAEDSKTTAADLLQGSERAIEDANRALAQLSEQALGAGATLTAVRAEMDRAETRLEVQRDHLARMLYGRYVAGTPETPALLLRGADVTTTGRELHYLTYIVRARSQLVAQTREDVSRLQVLAAEAERESSALTSLTAQQEQQRKQLEQERQIRARTLARVSRELSQQQRHMETLRRDEGRLTRLVDELARRVSKPSRPSASARRYARSDERVRDDRLPDGGVNGVPFAELRGRLALPVKGELAHHFGSPRQGGGSAWKGLFIEARPGDEVRAIAAGRVVFADWLRGFGNLLIIDHGDSYMSLYGYNETLFKQLGDVIRSGERVAAVGNSGGRPESGLYFEIRHEGRPFDPMTWVSVR